MNALDRLALLMGSSSQHLRIYCPKKTVRFALLLCIGDPTEVIVHDYLVNFIESKDDNSEEK